MTLELFIKVTPLRFCAQSRFYSNFYDTLLTPKQFDRIILCVLKYHSHGNQNLSETQNRDPINIVSIHPDAYKTDVILEPPVRLNVNNNRFL